MCRATTEVKQQILKGDLRLDHRELYHRVSTRSQGFGKRIDEPLVCDCAYTNQKGEISALFNAEQVCPLLGTFPCNPCLRVIMLPNIDQLGERVLMMGIDGSNFRGWYCPGGTSGDSTRGADYTCTLRQSRVAAERAANQE